MTETIAEGLRAGLAFIAVVLLARMHGGAFDRSLPAWAVVFVSCGMWAAAVFATHWSRLTGSPLTGQWRNCVAPALITLIVGGKGSVPLLLAEFAIIGVGTLAVGYVALRSTTVALRFANESPFEEHQATIVADSYLAPLTPAPSPTVKSVPRVESIVEEREQKERPQPTIEPEPQLSESLSPPQEIADELLATESWTRREREGEVSIEAVVLARFVEGSKLAVVHLPFVPPLPEVPQIECEPLDSGCEVTITTDATYRHGAKLSITRQSTGLAESVPIGIVIYTSVAEEIES